MQENLKVYVSSTSVDLKEYRAAVIAAIRQMQHTPICMEDYVSRGIPTQEMCLADVSKCDIYVGIIGWRYGDIPPGYDKSFTELEYRRAEADGITTLIFLLDENMKLPAEYHDPGDRDNRILALREELRNLSPRKFSTPDKLAQEVQAALHIHFKDKALKELYEEKSRATTPEDEASIIQDLEDIKQRLHAAQAAQLTIEPIPIPLPDIKGHFVDRDTERENLHLFLKGNDKRLLVIVAPAGFGKTELISMVLQEIVPGDAITRDEIKGILYLRCKKGEISLGYIFAEAGKILGKYEEFGKVYASKERPLSQKLEYLFSELGKVGNVLIVMDNFEDLLDPADDSIRDEELREFLETSAALKHSVRLVVTSRAIPKFEGSRKVDPIDLSSGLPIDQAIRYLREAGAGCGLDSEKEDVLKAFVVKVHCIPKALESVVGYLTEVYPNISINDLLKEDELFADFDRHDFEKGLKALTFHQYTKQSPDAQLVLSVLSIFPKPVPQAALRYLLPGITRVEFSRILARLVKNRLVSEGSGLYELQHPTVQDLVYNLIPEESLQVEKTIGKETNVFTRSSLHGCAAEYYKHIKKAKKDGWKGLEDLQEHLDQIYHLMKAKKFNKACEVLKDIDANGLHRFGSYQKIIELRTELLEIIPSEALRGENMSYLGRAYSAVGNTDKAITYFEKALVIARRGKPNLELIRSNLGNIGDAYLKLGGSNVNKAQQYFKEALNVAKNIRNKPGHLASANADLGKFFYKIGKPKESLQYLEKALEISRTFPKSDAKSLSAVGANLANIGNAHLALGNLEKAFEYYMEALSLSKENNQPKNIGNNLGNLARYYYCIGQPAKAIEFSEEAYKISKDLGIGQAEAINLNMWSTSLAAMGDFGSAIDKAICALALTRNRFSREETVSLSYMSSYCVAMGKISEALSHSQQALEMTLESGDRRGEGLSLIIIGRTYIASGDINKSITYMKDALKVLREVGDERYIGIDLCHLGIANFYLGSNDTAINYLQEALDLSLKVGSRGTTSLIYLYMGKCCHHSKDLKKAIEYYNEAITLDQINTKYIAMMGLGIASLENKDTEIAEQSFKNGAIICNELLRKTPNLWEPLQQLALSHLARGEVSLALENYEKALDVCSAPGVVDFGLRDIGLLERCSLTDLQTVRNLLKSRRKGV